MPYEYPESNFVRWDDRPPEYYDSSPWIKKHGKKPTIKVSDYAEIKMKEYCRALGLASVITEEAIDILTTFIYTQRMLEKPTMHSYAAVFIFMACRQARFNITVTHIVDTINAVEPNKILLLNVFNAIWFLEYFLKYNWYPISDGLPVHGMRITPVPSDSINAFLIDGEKKEFKLSYTSCVSHRDCCNRAGDVTLDNTYASTSPSFMDLRERLPYVEPVAFEEYEYDDEQPDAGYLAFLLGRDWEEPGINDPDPPGPKPPMYPAKWDIDEETATRWEKCDRRRWYPPDHMTAYIDSYLRHPIRMELVRNCVHWN